MRRNVRFTPSVDGLESRAMMDITPSGIGQDPTVMTSPPPGTTVELAPAPTTYDPTRDSAYVGFADGFTTTATLGLYTYSTGWNVTTTASTGK